jgi:hypothetical protein
MNTESITGAYQWATARADEYVRRTGSTPKLKDPLAKALTRAVLRGQEPSHDLVHDLATALRDELECA